PIEGARESFAEAQHLFKVAGAAENVERAEAEEKHGLTLPLREAIYGFFERHLTGRKAAGASKEIAVTPRAVKDLLVCADGQVNLALGSRHLLPLALEEFDKKTKPARRGLRELLRLDPESADFRVTEIAAGSKDHHTLLVLVNGNETRGWQQE